MNKDELLEKMNLIDDEIVTEAAKTRKIKTAVITGIAAAAAVLAAGAVLFIVQQQKNTYPDYPTIVMGGNEETIQETATDLLTEDTYANWPPCFKYRSFSLNGTDYEAQDANPEASAGIGEKLGDVVIGATNPFTGEETETDAAVFAISGVSSSVAVAVRYDGTERYYTAINPWYQPETLGSFTADLNLRENMIVEGDGDFNEFDAAGKYHMLRYEGLSQADFFAHVIDPYLDTPAAGEDLPMAADLDFGVSVPIFGQHHVAFAVSEEGFLWTNVNFTGKYFRIGGEEVRKIIDFVKKNTTIYEVVLPDLPGEGIPENDSGAWTMEETVEMFTEAQTVEE